MCRILTVFTSLWLCLGWLTVNGQNVTTLTGLTVFRAPFVEQGPDGKLKGYFVDLLDELALIGKFNYTLVNLNLPNSGPGLYEYTSNDMIIELYRRYADFAIADFLVRSSTRYVDFTEPYHVSGMSALVDKSRLTANNISSIEELLESKQESSTTTDKNGTDKEIAFGTVRSSSTYLLLAMANDSISGQVYMRLNNDVQDRAGLVDTHKEGIKRALNSSFALIQEAIHNELATDEHCELTELLLLQNADDCSKQGIMLEYSIAVQKMPKTLLNTFNEPMKKLKSNGKLDELRRRYWNRKCNLSPSE